MRHWFVVLAVVLGMVGCTVPLRQNCDHVSKLTVEEAEEELEAEWVDEFYEGEGDDAVWFATSFYAHKWCDEELGACGGKPPICTCSTELNPETDKTLVYDCLLFDEDEYHLEYVESLAAQL